MRSATARIGIGLCKRALPYVLPKRHRQKFSSALHPALKARLRRRLRPTAQLKDLGLISVIVPCFNVGSYLADCLDSILGQDYPFLEILVIDDGSPDGSAAIARGYARWDPRITVITRPNGGLGAARNTGINRATGEFITFVDSDDRLSPKAYSRMIATLTTTGSDFVVGNIRRVQGTRSWVPHWARTVHRTDRFQLTLDDIPEVLQDVFSWNKLFRRSFWDTAVGDFPEQIRYEDQEPTARAYTRSRSFDVLNQVVYNWLIRDDGTSITQQKANTDDLSDRLEVKRRVAQLMASEATSEIQHRWQAKAIGFDLRPYYAQVPRTDDAYWDTLRSGVRRLADTMDRPAWDATPVHDRMLALATLNGTRQDIATLLVHQSEHGTGYRCDRRTDGLYARPAYLGALSFAVDQRSLLVDEQELRPKSTLTQLRWPTPQTMEVSGFAYLPGLSLDQHESTIGACLVRENPGPGTPRRIDLSVDRFSNPDIDARSGDSENTYAASGFRFRIDTGLVAAATPDAVQDIAWHVELDLETAGIRHSTTIRSRDIRGSAGTFVLGATSGNRRIAARFDPVDGLVLTLPGVRMIAHSVALADRQLCLVVESLNGASSHQLVAECRSAGRRIRAAAVPLDGGRTSFTLHIPSLPKSADPLKSYRWRLRCIGSDGTAMVQFRGSSEQIEALANGPRSLALELTGHGYLRLAERPWRVLATDYELTDSQEIQVHGHAAIPAHCDLNLVLASGSGSVLAGSVSWDRASGAFTARFPTTQPTWGQVPVSPDPGGYSLRAITAADNSLKGSHWVPVHRTLAARLPQQIIRDHVRLRFSRTQKAAALWVNIGAPLAEDEEGRFYQKRLQDRYAAGGPAAELRDAVLFHSFGGRFVGDSPRAIFDELHRRKVSATLYWAVRDFSVPVPVGAEPLILHSRKWYELLHSAKVLVNNNNFPSYFRKSPGQFYVQTWHGTPLKQIGNDVPSANLSLSYRELMKREAHYWDVLLAQNSFARDTLPKAFGFTGRTVDTGYPRNDGLTGSAARTRREDVRRRLGIPPSHTVLLYAPTWRDNIRNSDNQYGAVQYFDPERARTQLGNDYTFLLRGHSNTMGSTRVPAAAGTIDVTAYPHINDLLLAADILVTDYSSVMFDFCVTRKPILILAPDLELYRGTTRGFYLDIEDIVPGPIVSTNDELVAALRNLPQLAAVYATKYAHFVDTFAPNDDGQAASRIVDELFGQVRLLPGSPTSSG